MAHSKQSDWGSGLGGLFVLYWIARIVADSFHISQLLAFVLVIGFLVCAIFIVLFLGRLQKWSLARRRCPHGIRAGQLGSCQPCRIEQEQRRAVERVEQEERDKKHRLKDSAKKLRQQELERLSQAWLSGAESYFSMDPMQFENAVAQMFRRLGYAVQQTPFSNDGGKDAIAIKDGKKYLIECKRYAQQRTIGRRDLQILVAAMQDENADAAFYINTGVFTKTAVAYALKTSIELYDRHRLPLLISEAYPDKIDVNRGIVMCEECGEILQMPIKDIPSVRVCTEGHAVVNNITKSQLKIFFGIEAPACDRCGSRMRLVGTGNRKFWGCIQYPKCRFTKSIYSRAASVGR